MTQFTESNSNTGNLLAALVGGIGVGLGIGLLLAPKSGRELRGDLAAATDNGLGKARQQVEAVRDAAARTVEKGKHTVQTVADGLSQAFEAGKKTYRQAAG
jgi:gas vesicle protein